jgi:hypothetical protein
MKRTIITVPDEIKEWLDNYSYLHHQSVAETIRIALEEYKEKRNRETEKDSIKKTAGLWKSRKLDGLEYVERLRKEW